MVALLWTDGSSHRWSVNLVTWMASALMVASGVIHLHLYTTGYKHIATIGPLFAVQGVASIVLALGASVIRRSGTALIGAGTMVATLAGFLITVNYGLFGFQDSFSATDALGALVIEIASAVLFLGAAVLSISAHPDRDRTTGRR